MANKLAILLGGSNEQVRALQELRKMTREGIDIQLIAEIMTKAHSVLRQLGLDPSNVTADETYQALMSAVRSEQWRSILRDTEFVMLEVDGQIISFNPVDVINNYHHQLSLGERSLGQAKRGLGWEISRRYRQSQQTLNSRIGVVAKQADWPEDQPPMCRINPDKPVIISIGDIASEAFITLDGSGSDIIGARSKKKIAIDLGVRIECHDTEVFSATGSASNAAVAMSKLGIQPSLMSWLGDDLVSKQTQDFLRSQGVDMSGVNVKKNARSNYHYVLRHGLERTILANYEKFDYRWLEPTCRPDWLYLSMISESSEVLHDELFKYLQKNSEVKFAFVPGPSHIEWGAKKLEKLYRRADIVIMNMEEAMTVTGRQVRNIQVLMKQLLALGPDTVVITDSTRGAYASDGKILYSIPAYPDTDRPVDRSGAGDAFAATYVANTAKGGGVIESLTAAVINSMSVVEKLGSQSGLLGNDEINKLEKNAAKDYFVSQKDL